MLGAQNQREMRSSGSGAWNELVIALPPSFRREKVVVPAMPGIGIAAAHRRAREIDRALACFLVEELADVFENVVFLMPEDWANWRIFCVSLFGLFIRNAEVARDAKEIALGYFDSIVSATVGRTF
jgi:hypothetical protein